MAENWEKKSHHEEGVLMFLPLLKDFLLIPHFGEYMSAHSKLYFSEVTEFSVIRYFQTVYLLVINICK